MSALNITKQNFQEEVLNSDKKVLIDLWRSSSLSRGMAMFSLVI